METRTKFLKSALFVPVFAITLFASGCNDTLSSFGQADTNQNEREKKMATLSQDEFVIVIGEADSKVLNEYKKDFLNIAAEDVDNIAIVSQATAILYDLAQDQELTKYEQLILDIARNEDVPVLLENATAEKMQKLTPVGVTGELVVLQYSAKGGRGHATILGDDTLGESTFSEIEVEQESTVEKTANRTAAARSDSLNVRGDLFSDIQKSSQKNENMVSAVTELLSRELPSAEATRSLGQRSAEVSGADCLLTNACYEFGTSYAPLTYGIGSGNELVFEYNYDVHVYATDSYKYVVINTTGSNSIDTQYDSNNQRGFFLNEYRTTHTITRNDPGLIRKLSAPVTASLTENITDTVGWDASLTGGASKDGPSASFGIGYNQSTATRRTITDWKTIATVPSSGVAWSYQNRYFNDLKGMIDHPVFQNAKIRDPGDIANSSLAANTEVVYRSAHNRTGIFSFQSKFLFDIANVYFTENDIFHYKAKRQHWGMVATTNFSVNLDQINTLPKPIHLMQVQGANRCIDTYYNPVTSYACSTSLASSKWVLDRNGNLRNGQKLNQGLHATSDTVVEMANTSTTPKQQWVWNNSDELYNPASQKVLVESSRVLNGEPLFEMKPYDSNNPKPFRVIQPHR